MAWATRIMDGVLRTLWEMGWHSLLVSLMRWLRVFLAVHTAVDHTRVQEQQKWLWPTSCFLLVFVGWTAGDCARCSLFHCLSYTPSPPPPSPHPPPSTPPFEAAATPPSPPPQPIPIPNQNSSLALLFSPSDLSSSDFSSSDSDESDSYHERARERIKKQLQLQLQLVAGSSVLLPPKPLTTDASSTDSDSDSPQESAMTPASATVQDLVPIGYNNRRDPPAPEPSAGSSSSQPPLSPPPPPPFTAASSAPRTGPTRKPPRPRMEKPPKEFWGYLISREHPTQPTPLFRRLLSSIADYVVEHIFPKEMRALTPTKLAAFYREVGGDLDDLFLLTPATKLSDIYSTLGCAHSLQQSLDDSFVPPSIPVLNSRGFETWQTIQLLLDPEEHVHYLQNAVKQFPLRDPETGELFPREIPADAFPRHPDRVTEKWHEEAFAIKNAEKKRREVEEQADLNSAAPTIVESEEEDWSYRPRRKHRHHHATYDDSEPYSRSAPGSGHEQPGRSSRGHSNKSHRQHHSYSHPTYTPEMVLETPVPSDTDDDLYRGHYTRATESHSRTRRSKHSSSQSNSRTRGTSRDYIGSYVYANGETAPIDGYQVDTYAQMTSEPAATYVRPSESHLHTYHSVPDIHYEPPTPQMSFVSSTPAEDDLRSRFLRHRSSSPATRAPLGPTPTATRSGSRGRVPYVEQGYEPPQEIYYDAEELVVEAERELERRRKKEARRVEKEAGRRKEHAYIQAHGRATGEGWGGAGYNGGRKSAGVSSYYPS